MEINLLLKIGSDDCRGWEVWQAKDPEKSWRCCLSLMAVLRQNSLFLGGPGCFSPKTFNWLDVIHMHCGRCFALTQSLPIWMLASSKKFAWHPDWCLSKYLGNEAKLICKLNHHRGHDVLVLLHFYKLMMYLWAEQIIKMTFLWLFYDFFSLILPRFLKCLTRNNWLHFHV